MARDEREAAELAGVTWQPEISKLAQTLQRGGDEESWLRLTRTRTNKTQVTIPGLQIIAFALVLGEHSRDNYYRHERNVCCSILIHANHCFQQGASGLCKSQHQSSVLGHVCNPEGTKQLR